MVPTRSMYEIIELMTLHSRCVTQVLSDISSGGHMHNKEEFKTTVKSHLDLNEHIMAQVDEWVSTL
jgi:hypothetical protein